MLIIKIKFKTKSESNYFSEDNPIECIYNIPLPNINRRNYMKYYSEILDKMFDNKVDL